MTEPSLSKNIQTAEHDTTQTIDFCTLGMFIIDEIHFLPPTPPVYNILGGAGSFSAIGARIFSSPPLARSVGWIVDAGNDFPNLLREVIASWGTSCLIRETPQRSTTRGWNGYDEKEIRGFKYMTPKLRLDHDALEGSLLMSKSYHLICSPTRCMELVDKILHRRRQRDPATPRPLFVWEPVPDLCIPEELSACYEALKHVDVVSPNHAELCDFFEEEPHIHGGQIATKVIERCCSQWLDKGIGSHEGGAVVVRAGKDGCYIATNEKCQWIPAYHQSSEKVIDPTGGGNTFLGGLCVGLARGESLVTAAIWGSVAASFAIEQVGMPELAGEGIEEKWNGERAKSRAEELSQRMGHVLDI